MTVKVTSKSCFPTSTNETAINKAAKSVKFSQHKTEHPIEKIDGINFLGYKEIKRIIEEKKKDLNAEIDSMERGIGVDSKDIDLIKGFSVEEKALLSIFQNEGKIRKEFSEFSEKISLAETLLSKTFAERMEMRREALRDEMERGYVIPSRYFSQLSLQTAKDRKDLKDPENRKLWDAFSVELQEAEKSFENLSLNHSTTPISAKGQRDPQVVEKQKTVDTLVCIEWQEDEELPKIEEPPSKKIFFALSLMAAAGVAWKFFAK